VLPSTITATSTAGEFNHLKSKLSQTTNVYISSLAIYA
jgi:hypothetical protein